MKNFVILQQKLIQMKKRGNKIARTIETRVLYTKNFLKKREFFLKLQSK